MSPKPLKLNFVKIFLKIVIESFVFDALKGIHKKATEKNVRIQLILCHTFEFIVGMNFEKSL